MGPEGLYVARRAASLPCLGWRGHGRTCHPWTRRGPDLCWRRGSRVTRQAPFFSISLVRKSSGPTAKQYSPSAVATTFGHRLSRLQGHPLPTLTEAAWAGSWFWPSPFRGTPFRGRGTCALWRRIPRHSARGLARRRAVRHRSVVLLAAKRRGFFPTQSGNEKDSMVPAAVSFSFYSLW